MVLSVSAQRKGSILRKEVPIQGSRALAKLFQEAWKKGAEAEQVDKILIPMLQLLTVN